MKVNCALIIAETVSSNFGLYFCTEEMDVNK